MEINLLKAMNHPNIVNHPQRAHGPLDAARAPGPMGSPLGMVDDVWMVHRFRQVDLHISIQIYPARYG